MIDIDSSFALPPGRLPELVTAVFTAQPADECDWVEWKSQLDLTSKHGQFTLARPILAFANRNPATVTQHLGGTAYILVGVQPGEIHGVTPVDGADLQPRLAQYLGSPGPFWRHHYVPSTEDPDRLVLVIEVPPPRPGEAFYPLAREGVAGPGGTGAPSGTIFIRRGSKTERADYAEMIMLRDRAARQSTPTKITDLGLVCQIFADDDPPLRALDLTPASVETWLQLRRQQLLKKTQEDASRHLGLTRMWSDNEIRTYSRSVDAYLEECRPYVEGIMTAALIEQGYNGMTIHVDNPSDEHLADVKLTITLPRGCLVIEAEKLEPGAFPPTPRDPAPKVPMGDVAALRPATRRARLQASKGFVNVGFTSIYTQNLGTIGAQANSHTCTLQLLPDLSLTEIDLSMEIRSPSLPGVERLRVTLPVVIEDSSFLGELVDPNPAASRRPRKFPVTHQHHH